MSDHKNNLISSLACQRHHKYKKHPAYLSTFCVALWQLRYSLFHLKAEGYISLSLLSGTPRRSSWAPISLKSSSLLGLRSDSMSGTIFLKIHFLLLTIPFHNTNRQYVSFKGAFLFFDGCYMPCRCFLQYFKRGSSSMFLSSATALSSGPS